MVWAIFNAWTGLLPAQALQQLWVGPHIFNVPCFTDLWHVVASVSKVHTFPSTLYGFNSIFSNEARNLEQPMSMLLDINGSCTFAAPIGGALSSSVKTSKEVGKRARFVVLIFCLYLILPCFYYKSIYPVPQFIWWFYPSHFLVPSPLGREVH